MSHYYPPPPGLDRPGAPPASLPPRPPPRSQQQFDTYRPPAGPGGGGGGRDRDRGRNNSRGRNRGGRGRDQARGNVRNADVGGRHHALPNRPLPSPARNGGGFRGGDNALAPPRGEFTFRAEKPAGVHEAQQRGDHYAPRDQYREREGGGRGGGRDRRGPPSGPRAQRQAGPAGHNERRGGGRQDGRRQGGRGGGFGSRFIAANRPILYQTKQSNGEVTQNFAIDNEGTTYLDLDELSDSDEAEMDISGDEMNREGEEEEDDGEDGDAPPKKRVRLAEKVAEEPAAPKWSNPDPYTVLPPTESTGAQKKKDVVHLIRKARVKAEKASALTSADTEEFISCDMDSDEDEDEGEGSEDGEAEDSDEVTRVEGDENEERRKQGGGRDARTNDNPNNRTRNAANSMSNSVAPADAPKGPRALHATSFASTSLSKSASGRNNIDAAASASLELNPARKRTYDDELKPLVLPDHAKLKKVTKMPVAGHIVVSWRVVKNEDSCPWVKDHSDTSHMGVWLHKEIVDFYNYIKPHTFEQELRQALIDDLDRSVRRRFPNARIQCFGSFVSGLYLPTGDMDICMCSTQYLNDRPPVFDKKGHLFKFGAFLCNNQIADRERLEHITKAKVPLVKYIDKKTGLKVDVSFENTTGITANNTFARWRDQYPMMPILVTLIKQFLLMRGLNEPVNGGIGGFSIICLVVSMLQLMPALQTGDMEGMNHLGELLMSFFDLYGNKFDYETLAIRMDPPGYVPKSKVRDFVYKNPDRLSIIDPNNPANDISGGSKNTPAIMRNFAEAFEALQNRMMELSKLPIEERANQSVLSVILEGNYSEYQAQRSYLRQLYTQIHGVEPKD